MKNIVLFVVALVNLCFSRPISYPMANVDSLTNCKVKQDTVAFDMSFNVLWCDNGQKIFITNIGVNKGFDTSYIIQLKSGTYTIRHNLYINGKDLYENMDTTIFIYGVIYNYGYHITPSPIFDSNLNIVGRENRKSDFYDSVSIFHGIVAFSNKETNGRVYGGGFHINGKSSNDKINYTIDNMMGNITIERLSNSTKYTTKCFVGLLNCDETKKELK